MDGIENKSIWDEMLTSVLIGLRFYSTRVLGVPPFVVCHGFYPRLPVPDAFRDLDLSAASDDDLIAYTEYLA